MHTTTISSTETLSWRTYCKYSCRLGDEIHHTHNLLSAWHLRSKINANRYLYRSENVEPSNTLNFKHLMLGHIILLQYENLFYNISCHVTSNYNMSCYCKHLTGWKVRVLITLKSRTLDFLSSTDQEAPSPLHQALCPSRLQRSYPVSVMRVSCVACCVVWCVVGMV